MELIDTKHSVIHAGRVLAGRSLDVLENARLEIENGLITKMLKVPEGPPEKGIIDLSGHTLIPGFVDCHVHLALDGKDFRACLEKWQSPEKTSALVRSHLRSSLEHGITAVRDGGDRTGQVLIQKDANVPQPRIFSSGTALRQKGKYGSFLGPGLEPDRVKEAVAFMARKGVDQIKVLASGMVSFRQYGKVGPVQFSLETLREIVETAGEHGLKVMAHASSARAVDLCARAGVHSIEHGYFLTRETLELMAHKGIYWIPTIAPVADQLTGQRAALYSRDERTIIERTYKEHLQMLPAAIELGVPVAIGTDAGAAGVLHGPGFHREMELFREARVPPLDIIRAATIYGARLLGLKEGLEPAHPARFIAVEGDPLKNPETLQKPRYVAI